MVRDGAGRNRKDVLSMDANIVLQGLDKAMIVVYVLTIVSLGLWIARKPQTSEGYFLAGRKLAWPFIGASLFAANISAEHVVGLAEGGCKGGMAIGGFEWMAVFCLAPLVFLFLPFYIRNKIYTVPEFLEKRFSPGVRLAFSAFMMILSILTKISIGLWATSVVFSKILGVPNAVIIWTVGLLTVLYTMKGGLRVVVYTDMVQTIVLLGAALILTVAGLHHVGGWSGLQARLDPSMFSMVRPATDPNYPWPGMFICVFILGSFYWSMDQVLVQRVFAAKDMNEGRLGAVFCGSLKILTPFLLVLPGLIAAALYPALRDQAADGTFPNAAQAYPMLLAKLMPPGLLGVTIAGLAAALMGTLGATYNSVATLFTKDIYLKLDPKADDKRQVLVGRIACFAVFVLGAAWAPMIGKFGGIFDYLQKMQSNLMMPFAGIFFMGVFWKRITSKGVLACLAAVLILSPIFIANAEALARPGGMGFLPFMAHPLLRPWLHSAFVVFALCMAVLIIVSLCTKAPDAAHLQGTTVKSLAFFEHDKVHPIKDYRLWFGVIVLITAGLWWWMA
jgi:solute:Na+ symporter, SSS family